MKHHTSSLLRFFPLPRFLAMSATGLDISDHSAKFISFRKKNGFTEIERFGHVKIPEGIIVNGQVKNRDALVTLLRKMRQKYDLRFVRASLPEEPAYIFTTETPRLIKRKDVRGLLAFKLEENVPLAPSEAVLDYDVLDRNTRDANQTVAVSVFPNAQAQDYVDLLHEAGLIPLSLEIEAQAIARALIPQADTQAHMIVDFGRTHSGISIVENNVVQFTTSVNVGGDMLSDIYKKHSPSLTPDEITKRKNSVGIEEKNNEAFVSEMHEVLDMLRNEMDKHLVYWKTHKQSDLTQGDIRSIFLSGGNANLKGLTIYLTKELSLPVHRGNVWSNVFSLDTYIPDIPFAESLGYTSSIGLALNEHIGY